MQYRFSTSQWYQINVEETLNDASIQQQGFKKFLKLLLVSKKHLEPYCDRISTQTNNQQVTTVTDIKTEVDMRQ